MKFNNHISPLTIQEMKKIFGGAENYGNTTERISQLIRKLLFGN